MRTQEVVVGVNEGTLLVDMDVEDDTDVLPPVGTVLLDVEAVVLDMNVESVVSEKVRGAFIRGFDGSIASRGST